MKIYSQFQLILEQNLCSVLYPFYLSCFTFFKVWFLGWYLQCSHQGNIRLLERTLTILQHLTLIILHNIQCQATFLLRQRLKGLRDICQELTVSHETNENVFPMQPLFLSSILPTASAGRCAVWQMVGKPCSSVVFPFRPLFV